MLNHSKFAITGIRALLCILTVFIATMGLNGCAGPQKGPEAPRLYGKCAFWEYVEKQIEDADELCRDLNDRRGYSCNRAAGHKGRHHYHLTDECIYIW